jgi:hypothetical protein
MTAPMTTLDINGQRVDVDVPGDTPLLQGVGT